MTKIGTLTADLHMETAAFLRDLKKAGEAVATQTAQMNKALRSIDKSTKGVERAFSDLKAGAVALAGALAVRQFSQFTKAALDNAGAVKDMADTVGESSKKLQELRFAATQSGAGVNDLETSLRALSRRAGEALKGNQTFVKSFKDLGITVQDLVRLHPDELIDRVADGAARLGSQSAKIAALDGVLSETGRRLVVMFQDGSKGLQEMGRQAETFGAVMTDQVIAKAKEAGDNLDALETVYRTSFDTAIIEGFADSITLTAENLKAAQQAGEAFGKVVGAAMNLVAEAAVFVGKYLQEIVAALAAFVAMKTAVIVAEIAVKFLELAKAIRAAAAATGFLTAIMQRNPIGLIATVVALGAAALIEFGGSTDEAAEAAKRHAEALRIEKEALEGQAGAVKDSQKAILERNVAMAKTRADDLRAIQELKSGGMLEGMGMLETISHGDTTLTGFQVEIMDFAKAIKSEEDAARAAREELAKLGEAHAALTESYRAAGDKLVNDVIKNLEREVEQRKAVLTAYQDGATAVEDANARTTAENALVAARNKLLEVGADLTEKQTGRVQELTQAQAELDRAIDVAKVSQKLENENAQLNAMLIAAGKGAEAVQTVNDAIDTQNALGGAAVASTNEQTQAIGKLVVANNKLKKAIEQTNRINDLKDQVALSKAEIGLINESTAERKKQMAVIEATNRLKRDGVDLTSEQAKQEIELTQTLAENQTKLEQMNEQRELFLEPFKNAIGGIQSAFADLFESIFSGGVDSFKDLASAVKTVMIRLASEIAALLVFRPVVGSILTSVGGAELAKQLGFAGIGAAAGGGGAAAAGGGASVAGSLGSVGASLITGFQSKFLGNLFVSGGQALGLSGNALAALGNAGLNLPFGALGSLGASLLGLGSGNFLIDSALGLGGSLLGGALGGLAGGVGGPIGAVIGSFLGTALAGLFGGGGAPKAFADTYTAFQPSGNGFRVAVGQTGQIGSGGDTTASVAGAFASAINQILDRVDVPLPNRPGDISFGFERGLVTGGINAIPMAGPSTDVNRVMAALVGASLRDIVAKNPESFYPALASALTDPFEEDLQKLGDRIEAALAGRDQLLAILDPQQTDSLAAAIENLNKQFDQLAIQAKDFNISQDLVTKAREREIQALKDQARAPFVTAAGGLVDFVRAQSLGSTSTLSPAGRLTEAQRQFGQVLDQVRAGNVGQAGNLTQAAANLLTIGRDNFASSVNFANLESFVNTSLLNVAEQLSSSEFFDAQVEATKQQTSVIEDGDSQIVVAIGDLQREIQLLRQQMAA